MSKPIQGFMTFIAGVTRMGKSYFAKKIFIPILAKYKPVIIFDRNEEYAGKFAVDHSKKWVACNGFMGLIEIMKAGRLEKKVYVISCNSDKDYISGLMFFQRLKQPVSIVLDEAHDIFIDNDFFAAKKHLIKLVRYGAKYGIDVVLITQRTMDIPPDIRSQFMFAISFHQKHSSDIKVIDENGWNGAEQLLKLEERQKILFGDQPPAHISKHLDLKNLQLSEN